MLSAMFWTQITRAGHRADRPSKPEPGKGLWIASIRVPHTDEQGTLEYFAIDGTIMLPRFCLNGYQRDQAFRNAIATFRGESRTKQPALNLGWDKIDTSHD